MPEKWFQFVSRIKKETGAASLKEAMKIASSRKSEWQRDGKGDGKGDDKKTGKRDGKKTGKRKSAKKTRTGTRKTRGGTKPDETHGGEPVDDGEAQQEPKPEE